MMGTSLARLRERARGLKRETLTLYFACRDPRTPWLAKVIAGGVVAYALSPIDLIPDFVPVPGYLDDLVIVPFGIAIAIRLVPEAVLLECRAKAQAASTRPVDRRAAVIIILIWIGLASLALWLIVDALT